MTKRNNGKGGKYKEKSKYMQKKRSVRKEVSFQKIIVARKRTPPVRDVGAQREVENPR